MFQRNNKDEAICGILVTHADDFVYCGTLNWHKNKVVKLLYIVKVSKREKRFFRYIGLNFMQMGKKVFVDQNSYKSSLKPVELITEKALQKAKGLTIEENSKLRSISGQLIRPDASFDSCGVNNYGKNRKLKNLLETNKAGNKVVTIFKLNTGLSRSWKPRISQSYCVRKFTWWSVSRYSDGVFVW